LAAIDTQQRTIEREIQQGYLVVGAQKGIHVNKFFDPAHIRDALVAHIQVGDDLRFGIGYLPVAIRVDDLNTSSSIRGSRQKRFKEGLILHGNGIV
jgi:hypothetical protein